MMDYLNDLMINSVISSALYFETPNSYTYLDLYRVTIINKIKDAVYNSEHKITYDKLELLELFLLSLLKINDIDEIDEELKGEMFEYIKNPDNRKFMERLKTAYINILDTAIQTKYELSDNIQKVVDKIKTLDLQNISVVIIKFLSIIKEVILDLKSKIKDDVNIAFNTNKEKIERFDEKTKSEAVTDNEREEIEIITAQQLILKNEIDKIHNIDKNSGTTWTTFGGIKRNRAPSSAKTAKRNPAKSRSKYENLCYTGLGANRNPQHTKKQFMRIMNKTFANQCREYKKSLRCKSCKTANKFSEDVYKKFIKEQKRDKTRNFEYSDDDVKMYLKLKEKCDKCKSNRTKRSKKCNVKDYVEYAGPEI